MKKETRFDQLNRRAFVKGSAAVVGGIMASQVPLTAFGHPNTAYNSGVDDAIKIGIIGCGGRGTGATVQALSTSQNIKLVAMADAFKDQLDKSFANITNPQAEHADKVKGRVDVPEEHKFVGFDAYQKVIPLVDVVLIATPPGFRPIHFEAAINADKHVFMEKPVATDAPGIRKVLEVAQIAKQKKLNVVVGLQRHYQTVYKEWVKRLHDGAIGEIVTSRVYWNGAGVWVRPRQAGQTEMEYQMRNWYYFNWLCGDHITEQHVHNLDVGNWVKQSYPVLAHGMGGRQVRTGIDHGEIFDHHFVEFEYADGSRMFSQCRHIEGCMNRVSEAFQGTKGTAPEPGEIYDASGNAIFKHRGKDDPNPYQVEHDELFAAVANGEYKFEDATNGANSTMTSILGRMATYSGQSISWDDALQHGKSLMPERYAWDANPPVMPDADGRYAIPIPGVTEVLDKPGGTN